MSLAIIQEKLLSYQCNTLNEQANALKEIAQEIALMALSQAGFFRIAAFQGGTCLRILYGLERFSEDLDFILEIPEKDFKWAPYLESMRETFSAYGYSLEVTDKSKLNKAISTAFLKVSSVGGILLLKETGTQRIALKIKVEVDTNPPSGSNYDIKYLDFPVACAIRAQDLPTLFAGKLHAILCRGYLKGRDWYDFIWYVSKGVPVNFYFLESALFQAGPWKESAIAVTPHWLVRELHNKIDCIAWDDAKKDVAVFLRPKELPSLEVWSKDFFNSRVEKMITSFL